MHTPPVSHSAPVASSHRLHLEIVITQGPRSGTIAPLDHFPFIIGRDLRSDLQLLDVQVSRLHCVFREHRNGLTVEDMGSRNGTMVNSRKIVNAVPITAGDLLIVGRTTLRVEELRRESTGSADETTCSDGRTLAVPASADPHQP